MKNRIGIISTLSYNNQFKLNKLFSAIKEKYGPYAIIQTGGSTGAEQMAKKVALELGFKYREFNPSYTGRNIYSALDESYYGKNFHSSHLIDRYKKLVFESDHIFMFIENSKTEQYDLAWIKKFMDKQKIKYHIVI